MDFEIGPTFSPEPLTTELTGSLYYTPELSRFVDLANAAFRCLFKRRSNSLLFRSAGQCKSRPRTAAAQLLSSARACQNTVGASLAEANDVKASSA